MSKKAKSVQTLFCYVLISCLIVGLFPATTFAGDLTNITEATKPTKKVVGMTEATKPDTQKTMQVTDVETQETKEVEIERPKKEKPTETQMTQKVPTTQQTAIQQTISVDTVSTTAHDKVCDENHTGWTALTADMANNALTGGKYYLENEVVLGKTLRITGDVTLCLNGYKLKLVTTGESSVIKIYGENAILTLLDDINNAGKITGGTQSGVFNDKGTFNMNGGTITGNTTNDFIMGGGVDNDGTFNMNGGIITGNTTKYYGGGVDNSAIFNMNGGTITRNITDSGSGGGVDNNGTFTMNGGTITDNTAEHSGGGVVNYGTFIMNNGSITDNIAKYDGGGVDNMDTFTMNDGMITGNTADSLGGGVANGSIFNMNGGTITRNITDSSGGGVANSGTLTNGTFISGTFNMKTGTITGNTANSSGGGVYNGGTFIMESSTISNNESNSYGGGVANSATSTFNMKTGTITGNTAKSSGGGVDNMGTFNMESGTIANNTAKLAGGGVCNSIGIFNMKMGTITGNTANSGGGVFNGSTFTINGGSPNITENFTSDDKTPNNVYLKENCIIDVVDTLEQTAKIGVTLEYPPTKDKPRIAIAEGNGYTLTDNDVAKFVSDDDQYQKIFENNTIYLGKLFENERTVTFNTQDGSHIDNQTVNDGGKVTKPTDPTKSGYTFNGWYKEETCTNAWNFDTDTVIKDITLYAKWIQNQVNQYRVTFNTQDGSSVDNQTIDDGGKVTKPIAPTKSGHTFLGWYKEAACTNAWDFDTDTVTANIILYAKWIQNQVNQYRVTFDTQGGSAIADQTVDDGGKVTKPFTNPTKSGYTFDGWYKEEDYRNVWNFDTDTVTSDITLYAKWTQNPPMPDKPTYPTTKYYTVTFDSNGGSAITSQTIKNGKTATMPQDPTKSGYTFLGWFIDEDFNELYRFTTPITKDIIVYAKWKSDYYVVTFDSNGGSDITSQTIENGKTATMPQDPTKSGYTFLGWFVDDNFDEIYRFNTPIIEDITIYAKWKSKSYSSSGGGGGRTGTWVKEEPNTTQTITPPVTQSITQYETVKQDCLRNETCPLFKFTDVDRWAWYHDGSHYCVENGLIVGTTNTTFSPDMSISRAMVVTILWRMENKPFVNDVLSFQDVKENVYYTEAVRWAAHNGIVSGYSSAKFAPNDSITREQMASILYRYTQYKNRDVSGRADISNYNDKNEISNYALTAIQWACDAGIINGITTTTLSPKGTTTRAQVAQMFKEYLEEQ